MQTVLGMSVEEALDIDIDEMAVAMLGRLKVGETVHLKNACYLIRDEAAAADATAQQRHLLVRRAGAAFQWLRTEGFVAPDPDQSTDWEYVTEAASSVTDTYLAERRGLGLLREAELDPALRAKVLPMFRRGQYPEAVFAAMREVEVRVRSTSGMSEGDIGVTLMKNAFKEGGQLHDESLEAGEAQARMALFWGAIGVYKNPPSHRIVNIEESQEAAEAVLFANNLLRIVSRVEKADAVDTAEGERGR